MGTRAKLGKTDIEVFPLCLGGSVFGWTADDDESVAILDAYVAAGGNFIDTADQYSNWVPGNKGGESEEILGRWMAARDNRRDVIVATKVGAVGLEVPGGLSAQSIRRRTRDCLERLGVETIELLYAHHDDPGTPMEETLEAFHGLVEAGTVRWLGISNYSAVRLDAIMTMAAERGLTPFTVLQTHYNLLERELYEDALLAVAKRHGLACVPFWTLAKGFLTGKYRPQAAGIDTDFSDRTAFHEVRDYDGPRSREVLRVLDELAAAHGTTIAAVALAWTRDRETVVAPLASARTVTQLDALLPMVEVELTQEEVDRLLEASAV